MCFNRRQFPNSFRALAFANLLDVGTWVVFVFRIYFVFWLSPHARFVESLFVSWVLRPNKGEGAKDSTKSTVFFCFCNIFFFAMFICLYILNTYSFFCFIIANSLSSLKVSTYVPNPNKYIPKKLCQVSL